jgi:hypothetical protein
MMGDIGRPRQQKRRFVVTREIVTLATRGQAWHCAPMSAAAPLRVFLSYAHEDAKHRMRVKASRNVCRMPEWR